PPISRPPPIKLPIQTTVQLSEIDPMVIAAGMGSEAKSVMTMTQKFATTCSVDRPTKIAMMGTMAKNFETTSFDKIPLMIAMLTTKFATIPSTNIPPIGFSTLPMEMVDNRCQRYRSANLADTPSAALMSTPQMRLLTVVRKTIHVALPKLTCLATAA